MSDSTTTTADSPHADLWRLFRSLRTATAKIRQADGEWVAFEKLLAKTLEDMPASAELTPPLPPTVTAAEMKERCVEAILSLAPGPLGSLVTTGQEEMQRRAVKVIEGLTTATDDVERRLRREYPEAY